MAGVGNDLDFQVRPANRTPEWSNLCNNLLDQYIDNDDLFGVSANNHEGSSSGDSHHILDLSGSSEQGNQTDGTSPLQSWEYGSADATDGARYIEAQQPIAKESDRFCANTLKALERNAAESEKTQKVRSAKSHPDFLSLGGYPTPTAIPASPTDNAMYDQRHRSRSRAPAGSRKASQGRSVSRGRPTGVKKNLTVDPNATIRKPSTSPTKMINNARHRLRDAWQERTSRSPKKHELQMPFRRQATSPPLQHTFEDVFSVPSIPSVPRDQYGDDISPLTNTFQNSHIYTPNGTPGPSSAPMPYYQAPPHLPSYSHVPHTVPLNDTAPLFPERTSSLAQSQMQTFDFGFQESDAWSAAPFDEPTPIYRADLYDDPSLFVGEDEEIVPSIEPYEIPHGLPGPGLGISCDPALLSNHAALYQNANILSAGYPPQPQVKTYYNQASIPNTPTRGRFRNDLRSESRSPPRTEPRSSRRSQSRPRKASRHRKTKSSDVTPRNSAFMDKGEFVNYTSQDKGVLLSGVAPSGSSKTKARRDKEAVQKRRQLSQAAVQAVVEAGGDVGRLSRTGLLV